jgi:ribosomal protein L35
MPKMKTHHATKKVLNKRKSGVITYKKSGRNHQPNAVATAKQVRQTRKQGILSKGTTKKLKDVI